MPGTQGVIGRGEARRKAQAASPELVVTPGSSA